MFGVFEVSFLRKNASPSIQSGTICGYSELIMSRGAVNVLGGGYSAQTRDGQVARKKAADGARSWHAGFLPFSQADHFRSAFWCQVQDKVRAR